MDANSTPPPDGDTTMLTVAVDVTDDEPCSGERLLRTLAEAAGATLRAGAVARGVTLNAVQVIVEGDRAPQTDEGARFTAIRLHFEVDTDASGEELLELIDTTERSCVVLQTLLDGVEVESSLTATLLEPEE